MSTFEEIALQNRELLNEILANSKKTGELPEQLVLDLDSKIRVSLNGASQYILASQLFQNNGIVAPQYKSVNYNPLFPFAPFVPTAGYETTITEIVDFINERTITIASSRLEVIKVLIKKTINGVETLLYSIYLFKRNNIGGIYGAETTNGPIDKYDLIYLNTLTPTPETSNSAVVIELGDIGAVDIVTYLNNNPQPVVGQNWELNETTEYWFSYTRNGIDIVDFYKGPKPVILGNQVGTDYDVVLPDFQRISTDGVEVPPEPSGKIVIEGIPFDYRPILGNDGTTAQAGDRALNNWISQNEYGVRLSYVSGDPTLFSSWNKDVVE